MKQIIFFITFLFFLSCNSSDNKTIKDSNSSLDTILSTTDSSSIQKIDTTTLDGKRAFILNKFKTEDPIRYPDFDTLIDLSYDGHQDYVIGYYGSTGSGIKNRIEVFLFNRQTNSYSYDSLLSDLANPTFYLDKRKITSFYIGNGGGGGSRLEWLNNKWTPTKTFTVDKQDTNAVWVITFPLKNKSIKSTRAFQMVPPDDILETNVKE